MLLFIASAFLTLFGTSQAARPGGGFHGGSFHGGFVAHSARPGFGVGHGIRRNFAFRRDSAFDQNRRFFHRDRRFFFQQFAWPVYWYPYYDPLAYSYLDYGPDNDFQYWDNSTAPVQPESFNRASDTRPIVIVINTGNSRPLDSSSNTGYVNSGYSLTDATWQQKNSRAGPERENRTASRSKDVRYSGSSTTYSNACKRYSNNTTSAGGGLW